MHLNLNENLKRTVQRSPENEAYYFMGERTSYAKLDQDVDRVAASLAAKGIGKGDKVALLLGNTPQFVISYYGILRTGAAVVPINPIYTANEITYILSNSEARAAVSVGQLEPLLSKLQVDLPSLEFIVYSESVGENSLSFGQLLQHTNVPFATPVIEEDDLAVILYTSGTTGQPKGAMLTHKNMASNAIACHEFMQLTESDRMIAVLPMFHVFCMTVCMNAPIEAGATMLILAKFSPAEVVDTIREEKATLFAGVPTMYNFIYQLSTPDKEDFATIRSCISGGAAIPVALLHKFEERFGVIILEGYGLSEAAPVTAFNQLGQVRKAGSIGTDVPGVKNKVVNEDGVEVAPGEVGELIVYGPNVMKGYLGMPEAAAAALRDGWLYTGDVARMDEDRYFYIVDRKKDMIIVGGYNVYPREVEEVLYKHPGIVEAAVIGVPNEEYGETVKAFVVKSDEQLGADTVMEFCRGNLAKYKVPTQIEFMNELPKNTTGKILRRSLRT
jgi:long-chain acyl-CoA synthetase